MRATSLLTSPLVAAPILAFGLFGLGACTGSGDDSCAIATAVSATEAGTTQDGSAVADATVGADAGGGGASPESGDAGVGAMSQPALTMAFLRIANWSSDAPPIDFCVAPHGTGAFQGPVLANLTAAINQTGNVDAGRPALSFPGVSAYSLVAPGPYDARLVAAGAPDCSAKIVPDQTNLPAVAVGQAMTIALVGAARPAGNQPGLKMIGLLDDDQTPSLVAIRAINASPDFSNVDVGTVSTGLFTPLLASIPFGSATPAVPAVTGDASAPMADSNGYLTVPAQKGTTFHVRSSGSAIDSSVSLPVSIGAGAIVTLVVVGTGVTPTTTSTDSGVPSAQIVEVIDNAGTVNNLGSSMVIEPDQ